MVLALSQVKFEFESLFETKLLLNLCFDYKGTHKFDINKDNVVLFYKNLYVLKHIDGRRGGVSGIKFLFIMFYQ